jgi:RNA-binding protein 23/39
MNDNGGDQSGAGGGGGGGGGGWKLEDDEGIGMTMNAQSRTALMAKLAGNKNLFPTVPPSFPPAATALAPAHAPTANMVYQSDSRAAALASQDVEGTPSFCFVIKNMFDIEEERRSGDPDWHLEIQQDVQEECENYGTVLHTFVEHDKPGGLVYVLFDRVESGVAAAQKLHGRWFSQRQISVRYLSSQEYVGMFPEARMAVQSARTQSGM